METASLQLPKDLIEGAIQREVSLAIAKALGDRVQILDQVVQRVLTQKVDDGGKPTSYGHSLEFVQWAVNKALQDAVKRAINEEIGKYGEVIRKSIADQLSRKNSPLLKQLVDGMTTGIVTALGDKWRLTVTYGKGE